MVSISETYDMSTKVNKLGMVAIHTPPKSVLKSHWDGFFRNYGKYRISHCNVALACASILPVDPAGIGFETGQVAPQDMFNPILYTAVSNDSFSTIMSRMYTLGVASQQGSTDINKGSVIEKSTGVVQQYDEQIYYGLLSNKDGFKRAMPQQGFVMKGLVPIVFGLSTNYNAMNEPNGSIGTATNMQISGPIVNTAGTAYAAGVISPAYVKGPAMRMPTLPTTIWNSSDPDVLGTDTNAKIQDTPVTYVGMFITPPAKMQRLYYRLRVTWYIEFSEPRSATDVMSFGGIGAVGNITYGTDYTTQSKDMEIKTNTVDSNGIELEQVM